uniref:C-type lectin domain-containing protein n=1 Tax=Scleropages formosus TaxID=113540 RepID=A0A8C9S0P0_SCLFO
LNFTTDHFQLVSLVTMLVSLTLGDILQADCKRQLSVTLNCVFTTEQVYPEGWRNFRFRCYYISREKKSWSDSQQFCRWRGADLVIINTREEQKKIQHSLKLVHKWFSLSVAWGKSETPKISFIVLSFSHFSTMVSSSLC